MVCWSLKKQNCVSLSTAEAEYIDAGSCCAQVLWMKQTLKDYGINVKNVPLYCDNESDVGFWVPAKPLRFEHWGAHKDLSPS